MGWEIESKMLYVCPKCKTEYQHKTDAEECLKHCLEQDETKVRINNIGEEIVNLRRERKWLLNKFPKLKEMKI